MVGSKSGTLKRRPVTRAGMETLASLARLVAGLAFGLWLGATLAVSFLATPRLFELLPRETARTVLADLFPRQYRLGVAASGVGTLAAAAAGLLSGFDAFAAVSVVAGLVAVGAAGYAVRRLAPAFADEAARARHHRQSVLVDALGLLGGGVAFVGLYF